jgi:hypothetical protein
MKNKGLLPLALTAGMLLSGAGLWTQTNEINVDQAFSTRTTVDWYKHSVSVTISLDTKSAGIKLPAGRQKAEALIRDNLADIVGDGLLSLCADSRDTLADCVESGTLNLDSYIGLVSGAQPQRSRFSKDFKRFETDYQFSLVDIASLLVKHQATDDIAPALEYHPSRDFTGIVIYATDKLPLHGTSRSETLKPCLFPKIWDNSMNLLLEKNMANPEDIKRWGLVAYAVKGSDVLLSDRVGNDPLKIVAQGLFGKNHTDIILSKDDSLTIRSRAANRELLRQGKVMIITDKAFSVTETRNDLAPIN